MLEVVRKIHWFSKRMGWFSKKIDPRVRRDLAVKSTEARVCGWACPGIGRVGREEG